TRRKGRSLTPDIGARKTGASIAISPMVNPMKFFILFPVTNCEDFMDSLTQIALGAAVGTAVMRGRAPFWKVALISGAVATLPDLDVFYDYGDAIRNMTYHRGESHAFF